LQDVQWAVGNSRGVRKLARTPHVNQKKKKGVQVPRDIEEAQTMLTRSKSMFKHGVCEREREKL
jgi:hypothetical protein